MTGKLEIMALDKNKLDALKFDDNRHDHKNATSTFVKVFIPLIIIAIGFGSFYLWGKTREKPAVDIYLVKMLNKNQESAILEASGYVVTRKKATLSTIVTARVLKINVEEGDLVSANDEIAVLDGSLVKKEITLSESRLKVSQSRVDEVQSQLKEAKNRYARLIKLKNNDYVSEDLLDETKQKANTLKAMLTTAQRNVQVEIDNIDRLNRNLEEYFIKAPFSGVVVSKNAQVGETISPVSSGEFTRTGICTIVDMGSREIEVDVNESYINRVKKDQKIVAKLDAYQDWKILGHVINIIPTADRQKATVKVRISIDELDPKILPDMGVKVKFFEQALENTKNSNSAVITIPRNTITNKDEKQYVWVITNNIAQEKEITTGARQGNLVEITDGVSVGDQIATSGMQMLKNNTEVIINSALDN